MNDLTVIYLTANRISEYFRANMLMHLAISIGGTDIITISKNPIDIGMGRNIVTTGVRSHVGIYRDALEGAKLATTKYIAIAEDDVLYSPEHFKKRPSRGKFGYNMTCWQLYTWQNPPIYSHSGRRNFGQLICERELFIEAMEERFVKYPREDMVDNRIWAEISKYENQLGVTVREAEMFYTDPANIMFTHDDGLSMGTIGKRKRLSPIRAWSIPYWGEASKIIKMYEKN